jgi:hypothetical protein
LPGHRRPVFPILRRPARRSWIAMQGTLPCARFRGKALNVDATGHAVVAHPIRAGLGEVVGTGPGSSSRVSGARLPLMRVSGQGPECRCNGTCRCRASNPRRVGGDRRNRAGFLVWRDATGGRSASLAKRCCATTHRLSAPEVGLFSPLIHACRVSMRRLTVQMFAAKNPESDSNCRTCPVWHSAIASCHARGFAPLALSAGYINKEII